MESSRKEKGPAWLEDWLPKVEAAIPTSLWILRGTTQMTLDAAYSSLSTLILELVDRWWESGPPTHVRDWSPYLATSAYRLHCQKPRKDARLIEFRPPVPTEHTSTLDSLDNAARPEETLILKEQFGRAAAYILELPKSQKKVVVFWALSKERAL